MDCAAAALRARIEDYLYRGLLPLWAEHGWDDARGGFHEQLEADHSPSRLDYRRLTVLGRQLYVFSQAAQSTSIAAFAALAHRAYDYLVRHFWDDRFGGWIFKVDLGGSPLDTTKDLYGHAFAMFGLAHYYRAFARREALEIARESNLLLKRHLLLPEGWFASAAKQDWSISGATLNQNPHMHLLEAYVALAAASKEAAFREDANVVVDLFHRYLFDAKSGTLGEFFDEKGLPHHERGRRIEPGHHFEWYWLLNEGAALWRDARTLRAAEILFRWAERHGVDAEIGGVFDALDRDGGLIKDSKRIWPQAERIKAQALRARANAARDDRARLMTLVQFLFDNYLLADGGWRESLERSLAPNATALPGTSPYHIFLALSEALKALAA